MTNMTKDEIKALQIKAEEIVKDADHYWRRFERFINGSDLWKDDEFDDIDKVAAEFEGRFAGFFREG